MDIELFLVGSLEQQVFWVFLDVVFSLSWVYKFATWEHKETTIQVTKQTFCVFTEFDWLERCHPYLAPILAIPCLPRSFQNILDALSVMLKCRQLRWLASLRFKAVPRVEIMFRLAQVLVRGAGLIKWYYMIIYKHRLKAWCSICLESMQIRKHWINSN